MQLKKHVEEYMAARGVTGAAMAAARQRLQQEEDEEEEAAEEAQARRSRVGRPSASAAGVGGDAGVIKPVDRRQLLDGVDWDLISELLGTRDLHHCRRRWWVLGVRHCLVSRCSAHGPCIALQAACRACRVVVVRVLCQQCVVLVVARGL